jgi:hypothetical protein
MLYEGLFPTRAEAEGAEALDQLVLKGSQDIMLPLHNAGLKCAQSHST